MMMKPSKSMMKTYEETSRKKENSKWKFYVVQFVDLPFECINEYICVPNSWIIRWGPDQKVVVAYPNNEDPFVTRDRAETRENYNREWRTYLAYMKYTSDSYNDAEYWIATTNDYESTEEELTH